MKIILVLTFMAITGLSHSQSLVSGKSATKDNSYLKQLGDQISVNYSYIHNLGQFGKTYESGSGVTLSYAKHIKGSDYLVMLRTGYMSHKLRSDADSGYADFTAIPIHIGGRYYLYKNIVMPYVSFMNGLNIFMGKNSVESRGDETLFRYAFQIGFGLDVKVARNFAVNLNINYNNSFYDDGYNYEEQPSAMSTGFEYSGGVSYIF